MVTLKGVGLLQLYNQTLFRISRSDEMLREFLHLCGRLYKYDFQRQVFIYAQRPDAVAVATKEIWTERMHRTIKKRSNAVLVPSDDNTSVIRYFDVSDTLGEEQTLPLVWQLKMRGNTLSEPFDHMVDAAMAEHNTPEAVRDFVRYVVYTRTKCDTWGISLDRSILRNIDKFEELGILISKASETVLRTIERGIPRENIGHESGEWHYLSAGRRRELLSADLRRTEPDASGQIRHLDAVLPHGGTTGEITGTSYGRQTAELSASGEQSEHGEIRADRRSAQGAEPAAREQRLSGDSTVQQTDRGTSERNRHAGNVQQISFFEGAAKAAPFLPPESAQEQITYYGGVPVHEPVSDQTEQMIREVLLEGNHVQDGKKDIYEFFESEDNHKLRQDFLKEQYGFGGYAFPQDNGGYKHADWNSSGIQIEYSDGVSELKTRLKWGEVATRISLLTQQGIYYKPKPTEVFPQAPAKEEVADPFALPKAVQSVGTSNYHFSNLQIPVGAKAKYQANVTAIRTLKQIEAENRTASAHEQSILAQYVGWGGLPQVFDEKNSSWGKEYTGGALHTAELSIDAVGSVMRIENTLKKMDRQLEGTLRNLEEYKTSLAKCEAAYDRPFDYEDELKEQLERQTRLNYELDLNKQDEFSGDEPDEEGEEQDMMIVVVEPGKPAYVKKIPGELRDMQNLVGGSLEVAHPFTDYTVLVCNENGKNEGLTPNRFVEGDIIAGTFFICGAGEDDFISLDTVQQRRYTERFAVPDQLNFLNEPAERNNVDPFDY